MRFGSFLSINRLLLLTRNTLILNRSQLLVLAATAGAIGLIISAFNAFGGDGPAIHQKLFVLLLLIGGVIISGRLFRDIHRPTRATAWFMTPASISEKFISLLLLSTIGFIVGTAAFWFLVSLVSEGLNYLLFKHTNNLFNPFEIRMFKFMGLYIILQAPFLLGAVYFKKMTFSKTVLSLGLYFIALLAAALMVVKLIFWNDFEGLVPSYEFLSRFMDTVGSRDSSTVRFFEGLMVSLKWVFRLAMAPLCWVIAFYRLKETEV
ncbi:MAG: hypothetical protein HKM93_12685 [Desulfobacteraceae bacterium]|nr:hypothetical protein [Desulfobacteraceae bacterium]